MWADIATILCLVIVVEGLLYALFPTQMKNFMVRLGTYSSSGIRNFGLLGATAGVFVIWLIRG
ncbi:MAG: hypothetical protein CMM32_07930 [Rhodospirillaceae bacterium]|nr:hypothetical protein [Rhodospirillaceae bacterium]